VESARLDDFKRNPQPFIKLAAEAINRAKRMALVDGINTSAWGMSNITRNDFSKPRSYPAI